MIGFNDNTIKVEVSWGGKSIKRRKTNVPIIEPCC
jgi:hypothetical protein